MVFSQEDVASTMHLRLALPPGWNELPMELEAYKVWVRGWVDDLRSSGFSLDDCRLIEARLRSMFIDAREGGMVLAAGYFERLSHESDGLHAESSEVLAVSVYAFLCPLENGGSIASSMVWHAALQEAEASGNLRLAKPLEVMMLGSTEVVKAVSIDTLLAEKGAPPIRNMAVTYYCTMPTRPVALVLEFRTPCVWAADDFEVLFDEIAGTLEFGALT